MAIGISTSCLYPEITENALEFLGKNGVKTCVVFLNSPGETTLGFAKELNKIKEHYGMKITSIHPFSSFAETTMFFSNYKRRFDDMLELYKRNAEVAAEVGAKLIVIHGAKKYSKICDEDYFERFCVMNEQSKQFGIITAQENVNDYKGENPDFLKKMRDYMGKDFRLVFDVKQAFRAGFEPLAFAEEFASNTVHIHLSDHNSVSDCIPPSKGCFDFGKLFDLMRRAEYGGDYVIELYNTSYENKSELFESLDYLEKIYLKN